VTTLAFIVFEWLKRFEPNNTTLHDLRIRSKSVHSWASAEVFSEGDNVEILLILYRLLTMQCKWMFTKRFTVSIQLVCTGRTSILNLLSEMFSTLRLSEMLFLFTNCLMSIFFRHFLQIMNNLRVINRPKNISGEKTRKFDTLAKPFQAMRSRTICWEDYRITPEARTPRRF